ncbi:hypothetical protein BDZ89DRAFT_1036121 [Hymenopellis radicata]|nr:hypothetical protein BDZ89DRAFT_1036121 [Hymenopellis radicata]
MNTCSHFQDVAGDCRLVHLTCYGAARRRLFSQSLKPSSRDMDADYPRMQRAPSNLSLASSYYLHDVDLSSPSSLYPSTRSLLALNLNTAHSRCPFSTATAKQLPATRPRRMPSSRRPSSQATSFHTSSRLSFIQGPSARAHHDHANAGALVPIASTAENEPIPRSLERPEQDFAHVPKTYVTLSLPSPKRTFAERIRMEEILRAHVPNCNSPPPSAITPSDKPISSSTTPLSSTAAFSAPTTCEESLDERVYQIAFKERRESWTRTDFLTDMHHIYVLAGGGDTILVRVPAAVVCHWFRIQVVSNRDVRSPIITLGSTSFFHVRFICRDSHQDKHAALLFEFCYRFINICKTYLGKSDGENFVLIYEFSTIIDFVYLQNSEIDTLKTYITTQSIVSPAIGAEESSKIMSWRRGDVKYKKNEAFVDVVETVAKGTILHADVDSHI